MNNVNLAELGESSTNAPFSEPVGTSTETCPTSAANIDAKGNYSENTEPKRVFYTALGSMSTGLKRLATIIDSTVPHPRTTSAEPERIAEKPPPGWPSIADRSAFGHNTSMFPKFEGFAERIKIDQQTKLWALNRELSREDKRDEDKDCGRLNTLIFDFENLFLQRPPGGPHCHSCCNFATDKLDHSQQPNADRKDCIMEASCTRLIRYYLLLWLSSQVDTFIKVSQNSYNFRREYLESELPPDSDASQALFHKPDDFITTRSRQVHKPFEGIINSQRFPFLKKWLVSIFNINDKFDADPDHDFINTEGLDRLYKATTTLLFAVVQIAPIAILLLVELSKTASLGVVIIFSVLFVMVMNMLGAKSDGMLAGYFSAYLAVLVVFLGNLQQAT